MAFWPLGRSSGDLNFPRAWDGRISELTMFQSLLETIAGGMTLSAEQLEFIRSLWMPRDFRKGQFFQRAGEVTTHGDSSCVGAFVLT